jgi:hypothetical protein
VREIAKAIGGSRPRELLRASAALNSDKHPKEAIHRREKYM